MITETQSRNCLSCNKTVRGRTDKKFCDDFCRNNYNNQLRAGSNNMIRNINNALAKNRRILEGLIGEGEEIAKTTKERLLQKGFLFKYFTHHHCNARGNTFVFCYDHGYLSLNSEDYLVVKNAEDLLM